MDYFSQGLFTVVTHPHYYLGVVLSFAAGFAFLIFLRGFLSGVGQLFTIDKSEYYLPRYRKRATWGIVLLLDIFLLWICVRMLEALFVQAPINWPFTFWIVGLWVLWQLVALRLLKNIK